MAACLFFAGLGRLPLLEPDEGRNAEVARELLASGDYVIPHFNTLPYLDKPVFFFWLVSGAFRLAGISEWAARLPSALAGLGTVLLTWFLGRRMSGDATGLRAGVVLATSPLMFVFSRLVIFDMTLTFLVTLALVSFWLASSSDFRRTWLTLVFFAAQGLATLTKGPVGFLLPWLSILVYQAVRGKLRDLKRLPWAPGLAVFFAVVLPWFIAVSLRNSDFPRYALWEESLKRFATGHARRSGSFLYYLPVFLAGFFPWSLFLLFAGWRRLKAWRELRQEENKDVLFLLAWSGTVFAFFSISQSKLPAYFLPATIPLAVLAAQVWGEAGAEPAVRPPGWLTAGFAAVIATGLLLAGASQVMFRFASVEARAVAKIHPAVLLLIKPSLLYAGLILIALGIVGRNLAGRAHGRSLSVLTFVLVAFAAPAVAARWRSVIRNYAEASSGRALARTILASPEKDWPLYGYYYFRTSLPFYLGRPVGLVTSGGSELTSNYVSSHLRELRMEGTPAAVLLIDGEGLRALARSKPRATLVLARKSHAANLLGVIGENTSPTPLWSEWQDTVWEIPAAEAPAVKHR